MFLGGLVKNVEIIEGFVVIEVVFKKYFGLMFVSRVDDID